MRPLGCKTLVLLLVPVVGFLAAGCQQATTTVTTGPTPVKCAVTLQLNQGMMPAAGGAGSVAVATTADCSWTAVVDVGWITNLAPANGQGPGQIQFQVPSNPSPNFREGQIIVNDIGTRVTQAGTSCQVSLDPTSNSFTSAGGTGGIAVTAAAGCTWTATSNASWLIVTSSPPTGNGPGTVTYSVQTNTGVARVGVITIADQTFVVTQLAPETVPCNNSISPTSQSLPAGGGSVSVSIQAIPSCSWTAASNVFWLAISGVGVGSGNGSVTVVAQANTGATRTGTATIAGQTFTVTQAGSCATSLAPISQSMPVNGGAATPVAVTVATGCAWTATPNDGWITITGGASGNGNGTVNFTVAANTGGPRSGTISISGQTHTVNQAGNCTASINPTSQSIGAGGGAGTPINVTTPGGCTWTASTADTWISITSGATGNGNGTVNFTIAANTGPARTGTLSVAAQTFTVNQASGCTFSINPTSQSIGSGGGAGTPINVTAPTGCTWTATPNVPWITVTAGTPGNGNGTVNFTVGVNTGAARSGTITVAGQTFTVNQALACTFSINPTSQSIGPAGGAGTQINVTAPAGCAWTAAANDNWITVTTGATGSGNGTVNFTVGINTGPARSGTLTVAGQTYTVNQQVACSVTLNPVSQTVSATGGVANVTIAASGSCNWAAVANDPWLTITAGATGSGNGTVTFTVAANSGAQRVGTITINNQTHTVTQSPAPASCTYQINPTSMSMPSNAMTSSAVTITTQVGCPWSSVPNVTWITIQTGASGTGSGSMTFRTTNNNSSSPRTGTITIAGITFTVTQAGQ